MLTGINQSRVSRSHMVLEIKQLQLSKRSVVAIFSVPVERQNSYLECLLYFNILVPISFYFARKSSV